MDDAETELCDVIKPTITERVAVVDNSAPRIQVGMKDLQNVCVFCNIDCSSCFSCLTCAFGCRIGAASFPG